MADGSRTMFLDTIVLEAHHLEVKDGCFSSASTSVMVSLAAMTTDRQASASLGTCLAMNFCRDHLEGPWPLQLRPNLITRTKEWANHSEARTVHKFIEH